ncbi:MAG: hypothetical protein KJ072_09110 [Verrucomicrobia bacterium]|nr:hypothetical protein [Verrucomicrobiota bacterium]
MTQDVIDQGGQYGTVPVECFRPIYHAIGLAVGQGIIVIEPAANGGQNLDAPIYRIGNGGHWPFLPKINLGAIMVGAGVSFDGSSAERSRLGFSNYSELLTLKRHTSAVGGVALSPDGNRLASASADGTVKVWDATPRSEASAPEAKTR